MQVVNGIGRSGSPQRSGLARRIGSVLVANRGEIVVRVSRTLGSLGIRSIAIYAPEDASSPHTRVVDVAVAVDNYLDVDSIVAAAKAEGADAVHPGYGFLSEDPAFARAVLAAGLAWVGPPPDVIEAMGDKIRAKETVAAAGVPVVPGAGRRGMDDAALCAAALAVGLPVLVKPAAGGGGKGIQRVRTADDLLPAIATARREAIGAFGDGTLLVERWVERPRHVEVQVFADTLGNIVHLGERECSLQRRHQKIVEESPSPLLDDDTRRAMAGRAVDAARACGYVGAGTVEFVVPGDRPDEHFFVEMNTRLQVEHPVTEAVTGVDLVEWQLRVAAGEALPLAQAALVHRGHAVEARVYAEDPVRGFLPSSGTAILVAEPEGARHVRVDSALAPGTRVGTRYDPLLAKVVALGTTRVEAFERLRAALGETAVLGLTTNVGYLTRLVAHADVLAGRLDTGLVDRTRDELAAPAEVDTRDAAIVATCCVATALEPAGAVVDPWDVPDGWSVAGPREWTVAFRLEAGLASASVPVAVRATVRGRVRDGAVVRVGVGAEQAVVALPVDAATLAVTIDGVTTRWRTAMADDDVWVSRCGDAWRFVRDGAARGDGRGMPGASGPVTSPMPGVVAAVHVTVGDTVHAGQALVAVEAMKTEHAVVASADGVVAALLVRPGQSVGTDQPLVRVEAHQDGEEEES